MEFATGLIDEDTLVFTGRLLAALTLSGIIGFEREARDRPAGLRTHILVSVGACLFTLLMLQLIERQASENVQADPVRIIEAITAGVAFLAAGAIIQGRGHVRGLTTGASLWVAGAIGVGCGLGEYTLSIIAVMMTIAVLHLVPALLARFLPRKDQDEPVNRDR